MLFHKRFFVIWLVFLLSSVRVNAQQHNYSVAQLNSDFSIFRQALEEAHPSLYRFHSKLEMDQLFDSMKISLREPMSEPMFYRSLARIIARIGCGHTSLVLSDHYVSTHPVRTARFPFDVKFINGRLFIVKDHRGDGKYWQGQEVVSIDGVPIQMLVNLFLPMMNGDGYVTTSKYKRLEQFFGRLVQVLYRESASYEVGLKDARGTITCEIVKLVPVSSIAESSKPDLMFEVHESDSQATLTVRTFGDRANDGVRTSYREFIAKSFRTLKEKKIQTLIIDLRGNGGGRDDFGALLYSYLTSKPFQYYDYLEMKLPNYSFLKYTDQSESFKAEVKCMLIERKPGLWVRKDSAHPCLLEQKPQADFFGGSVLVLIDGLSFSATAEFCSIVRYHQRAKFIGEETGGTYEGNTSGGGLDVVLPNTNVHVRIPLTKYVCKVKPLPNEKGRGIIPEYHVSPTLKGLLDGRDEVLEFAKSIATKTK